MAITASFSAGTGTLTVLGDGLNNAIAVGRDAAGSIQVNGGAVPVLGGVSTVANTALMLVFGNNGADTIALDEANGALPAAHLFGGFGDDLLTGGSSGDQLFGQAGNDALFGGLGNDTLRGGDSDDTLTGGDGDDQVFGEAGDDRLIWNGGDDNDLFEGGDGIDIAEVNGGDDAESFTITANGGRVRFDRIDTAPFALDVGTTENLVLNAGGGNDSVAATGNLAALIKLLIDGGGGNDTILGGNGADSLLGGGGNDFIDGQQGNDAAFLGAGDDVFQWDPGDGSDLVEGQEGFDTLAFNGSSASEKINLSANGGRVSFSRDVAAIAMDLDDIEFIKFAAQGGSDNIVVGDLSATDVLEVAIDLRPFGIGAGDGQADSVTAHGSVGGDSIEVVASGGTVTVAGLSTLIQMQGFEPADRLTVSGNDGDDLISASTVPLGAMILTLDGGAGNDTLVGSGGNDTLLGGTGNDLLDGGAGNNTLDGGIGNDTYVIDSSADFFVEDFDAGIDTVKSLLNFFELGANVENLAFIGSGDFTGMGNGFNNVITGNVGNDFLKGAGGDDRLFGNSGADFLSGSDGNDILAGGSGADTLAGGDGIDTADYSGASQGVVASLSDLSIASGDALGDSFDSIEALTGSRFADALTGNVDANRLRGGTGNDQLSGLGGNDIIDGGRGADTVMGGLGNDRFDYAALNQGGDRIEDFSNVVGNNDMLRFAGSAFGGLPTGALDASRFTANVDGIATSLDHRFVYETDTGILRYDANGSDAGGVTVIATLTGIPVLTASDVFII
jgi:Ca2+-binding RTX toxin-like protein